MKIDLKAGRFAAVEGWYPKRTTRVFRVLALLILSSVLPGLMWAQDNKWSSLSSGKWENGANWSLGVAPNLNHTIYIANGVSGLPLAKTITLDSASTTFAANLVIQSLRLGGGQVRNTLFLNNAGLNKPVTILSSLFITNRGAILITNSVLNVTGAPFPSDSFTVDGNITIQSGSLIFSNRFASGMSIGNVGNGALTLLNGTWHAAGGTFVEVGSKPGSSGLLTIVGGTARVDGQHLTLGAQAGSLGTVLMTGGELITYDPKIGRFGVGEMTVSNGTWRVLPGNGLVVGQGSGSRGTLTLAGGSTSLPVPLSIASGTGSTGSVWLAGGELLITNQPTYVGSFGVGRMAVSNGFWRAARVLVGADFGFGTLAIAGGTSIVSSNLTIGGFLCEGKGGLTVSGGNLSVTNAGGTSELRVSDGTFTLAGGTVRVDVIDLTSECAHFVRTGGTLIYGSAVLDPQRDDDGDGLLNALEQSVGYDPLDPRDGLADTDGDGVNDTSEILAGTNPTNALSYLRIVSVLRQGNDVRIRWATAGGKTNVLQASTELGIGALINPFVDLATITIPGTGDRTNTFIDADGALVSPARFYRIKVIP